MSQPPEISQHKPAKNTISRRHLLAGIVASGLSGTAGVALGYKYSHQLQVLRIALSGRKGREDFRERAQSIQERHRRQTVQIVTELKNKYENAVFGKMRVWDLVEKLHQCIDPTDTGLFTASQFVHTRQVLAAMEQNGITDSNFFISALVHDLGKVLLLTGEVPENVVCQARRIGEYEEGIGLDNIVYQFGHGEFIYSRLKDHVPDQVAWLIRYHSINQDKAAPYMDARDREYTDKYLLPFRKFDGGFKSPYSDPRVDMAKYRDLIEQYFPRPILF